MKLFGNRKHAARVQKKDEKQKKTIKLLLIIAASLAMLVGGGFAAMKMLIKPVSIKTTPRIQTSNSTKDPAATSEPETEQLKSHIDGVYNVLVCGTDNDGYRTDTIIIAHLDTRDHSAALMSIPRDTVVVRGDHISKINSVYAGGKAEGMQRLGDTLEQMLGFPMDAYLLVDLQAFKDSVDLIGGVWFDVPQDMFYEDPSQDLYINLKQGYQLLDGEHAMELVRYRKGYASQDIQRTSVQQDFLFALTDQCIQSLSLTKISGLARIFKSYVTTDMTTGNLLYFASEIKKCSKENLHSYTPQGAGKTINGGSYYPLFDWSVLEIVNESFNPYDAPLTAGDIHVVTPNEAEQYDTSKKDEPQTLPEEADPNSLSEQPEEQTDPSPSANWAPSNEAPQQPPQETTTPPQPMPPAQVTNEQPPAEWQAAPPAEWAEPSQVQEYWNG